MHSAANWSRNSPSTMCCREISQGLLQEGSTTLLLAADILWQTGAFLQGPPAASRSEQTHLGKRRCRAVALPFRWAIWLRSGLASSGPGHQSAPDFQFHCFDLPLQATAGAVEMAERTGFFTGIWSVCSCGDPGDGSSFVWIWGHTLFLVLDYLGDTGINNLHLFPPMLPPEEIEKRRKADRKD